VLDELFKPTSVAIIGASTKELSIGNRIIKNLIDFGYKGSIYPINPKADEVREIKAFNSILDVKYDIDLAHIVIPNKFVPQAIDDCGKKGVKVVIINSAGFKEIGEEGRALEEQVVQHAQKYNIRIFGPNCQGIINTSPNSRAYCNFTFTKPKEGCISIVAQSGGVGEVLNQRFSELGVGIRMYASNGNACDISIPEIISYWGEDLKTKVIVVHVENLSDPREFMDAAQKAALKKPILGMKTGRTKEGAKAVSSHTGGLAKIDIATELIFKKCGIVTFRDQEELCQAAIAFASQPVPKGKNVGVITNTGGPAIIATDELIEAKLHMPPLSDTTKQILKEKLYSAASINNPIDVLATGGAHHFRAALDVLMDEPQIHSIFINFVTPFFVDTESIAHEITEVNKAHKKPIICNLMTDKRQWTSTINTLKKGGVPCYDLPETAARALIAMTTYYDVQSRDRGKITSFTDIDEKRIQDIIQTQKKEKDKFLSAKSVNNLLTAYQIPVAKWQLVNNSKEALKAACEIGFPVVVKVDSDTIIHKTDVGGIALNLGKDEVVPAVKKMEKKFSAANPRFLIQEFLPGGTELFIGAKAEKNLGHLILFGIGGIYVEILKDVSFGITPITKKEAQNMLSSIKSYPILSGFRGKDGVNQNKLIEILQRMSQLVTSFPMIKEIDLNPIIAKKEYVFVADARIKV
jgi:acetyltransferase